MSDEECMEWWNQFSRSKQELFRMLFGYSKDDEPLKMVRELLERRSKLSSNEEKNEP